MITNLHSFKLTVEDNNPGARFELRAAAAMPERLAREPVTGLGSAPGGRFPASSRPEDIF